MGRTIVVYDKTEDGYPWLSTWWSLGAFFSGADDVFAVSSWGEVYRELSDYPYNIDLLSIWGHGRAGAPLINGAHPLLSSFRSAVDGRLGPKSEIWWRSCDVHKGRAGKRFAESVVETLGCASVGHCAVISAPNPLWQREICALRPGEAAWWSNSGSELPGCSTLRMTVPKKAYKGGKRRTSWGFR